MKSETFFTLTLPFGAALPLQRRRFGNTPGPRLAVCAGVHGDELEGLYLCHRLAAWLEPLQSQLNGGIDLYPMLNPLALNSLKRTIPGSEADLNRSFPGHAEGLPAQRLAAAILQQLQGYAAVLDVHASNRCLDELPQARIDLRHAQLSQPIAKALNLPLTWQHGPVAVLESTLTYSLNAAGTPALLVELGSGDSCTPRYAERLLLGIQRLAIALGILPNSNLAFQAAQVVGDDSIYVIHAEAGGLFLPLVEVGYALAKSAELGHIVSPLDGEPLITVRAPVEGLLFTLRRPHLVYQGAQLARIASTRPEGGHES